MENGKGSPDGLIIPAPVAPKTPEPTLTCHRFYAPLAFPEPDRLDPRKATITPRLGNFNCIREKCTLWNVDKGECWDVTAARGQALLGEFAYAKLNDVHLEAGGQ